MAGKKRTGHGAKNKRAHLRYFFVNKQLHRSLQINRPADLLIAWNYPEAKKVTYTYTDVLRRHQKAFTSTEVCKMFDCYKDRIDQAIANGGVERPQFTYTLDENRRLRQYMWMEEEIYDLHAYFLTVHRGRPRNDGRITPQAMPTLREIRAMIHDEAVLYVKQGDNFVPTWRAKEF